MPPPDTSPLHISVAAAQKLRALAADLQVAPETIIDTAAMLLETLLSYNRKGYARATLRHAIFRNADREIDIDIPAAADYYQNKALKDRQMAEALGKTPVEMRVGGKAMLAEAGPHPVEAKLVDLTVKVDAIAAALQILLQDIEPPSGSEGSGHLAGSALAEMDSFMEDPTPEVVPLIDDDATPEPPPAAVEPPSTPTPTGLPAIKPPATFGNLPKPTVVDGPGRAAGSAAFAELDYSDDGPSLPGRSEPK